MLILSPRTVVEVSDSLSIGSYYKLFMDANSPRFSGKEEEDKAEE